MRLEAPVSRKIVLIVVWRMNQMRGETGGKTRSGGRSGTPGGEVAPAFRDDRNRESTE